LIFKRHGAELPSATADTCNKERKNKKQWKGRNELKYLFFDGPATKTEPVQNHFRKSPLGENEARPDFWGDQEKERIGPAARETV
jgi:hypothetical protein